MNRILVQLIAAFLSCWMPSYMLAQQTPPPQKQPEKRPSPFDPVKPPTPARQPAVPVRRQAGPAPVPVQQSASEPAQQAPANQQEYDARRLLTIWDLLGNKGLDGQAAAFKAEDGQIKNGQDILGLFLKYYPEGSTVQTDPKFADPADLVPAKDPDSPMYKGFQEFKRWRTNPVGPEIKDLNDLRAHRADILKDIDETPLEQDKDISNPAELRKVWKRRVLDALDYNWPWVLGLAKLDVLSPVHKLGTYKKDGQYHIEKGMLNRLKGKDATQPVLRLWLPELSLVIELAFRCRNGFIVQLEVPTFRVETVAPSCSGVRGEPTKFTSDTQRGSYQALLSKQDLDVRDSKWTLNSASIQTDSIAVSVMGGVLKELPEVNRLAYSAEAREKGNTGSVWYPVTCSIDLTKQLPPPPPPPPVKPPPPPPPPPPCLTGCKNPNTIVSVGNKGVTLHLSDFVALDQLKGRKIKSVTWQANGNIVGHDNSLLTTKAELENKKEIQFSVDVELEGGDCQPIHCEGRLRAAGGKWWILVIVAAAAAGGILAATHHGGTPTPAVQPSKTGGPPGCTYDPATNTCHN